jgi:hypothetical protein
MLRKSIPFGYQRTLSWNRGYIDLEKIGWLSNKSLFFSPQMIVLGKNQK